MAFEFTERQQRWLTAFLVLATVAVAFVVVGFVSQLVLFFGDIILVFFLAWLLAFILSPLAGGLMRLLPGLPRPVAVILAYGLILGLLVVGALLLAESMATSISQFVSSTQLSEQLPRLLAPWQERLAAIGLGQVDLVAQGKAFLDSLRLGASELIDPLRQLAVASLGVLGNLLIVLILSLYMALDRDRILSFLFRLVPPGYTDEARLLESSVSRSFGGFLRGQAVMGLLYAAVAALTSAALHLDYLPVTTAAVGVLQAIPFFGPFLSWAPPVLVALLLRPDATLPALLIMGVGWFLVMNVVQPRLMSEAVGIHPIVVLASVLIGSKVAGVAGAIFGIPIAAVCSAFFFYYLGHTATETRSVAARAARRLEEREGRRVRIPREPLPGQDRELDEAMADASPRRLGLRSALPGLPLRRAPAPASGVEGSRSTAPAHDATGGPSAGPGTER
ncbi:MAG TPA: AI-2E family transporter [Candidatus Limnocylindrales bacterium]